MVQTIQWYLYNTFRLFRDSKISQEDIERIYKDNLHTIFYFPIFYNKFNNMNAHGTPLLISLAMVTTLDIIEYYVNLTESRESSILYLTIPRTL